MLPEEVPYPHCSACLLFVDWLNTHCPTSPMLCARHAFKQSTSSSNHTEQKGHLTGQVHSRHTVYKRDKCAMSWSSVPTQASNKSRRCVQLDNTGQQGPSTALQVTDGHEGHVAGGAAPRRPVFVNKKKRGRSIDLQGFSVAQAAAMTASPANWSWPQEPHNTQHTESPCLVFNAASVQPASRRAFESAARGLKTPSHSVCGACLVSGTHVGDALVRRFEH